MTPDFMNQLFVNAMLVIPVFAPIIVGVFLKRFTFMQGAFWPQVESKAAA